MLTEFLKKCTRLYFYAKLWQRSWTCIDLSHQENKVSPCTVFCQSNSKSLGHFTCKIKPLLITSCLGVLQEAFGLSCLATERGDGKLANPRCQILTHYITHSLYWHSDYDKPEKERGQAGNSLNHPPIPHSSTWRERLKSPILQLQLFLHLEPLYLNANKAVWQLNSLDGGEVHSPLVLLGPLAQRSSAGS